MSTTLEVILKTAGFTEGATAIKKVGDEATNTNNKLKTTTSTVDQVSKSTTSLGSKLANAGKQFSGTITNVAALGSTVVNLNRQYQDLSDTQIRVDKTQLKMSKTAEAVRAAQDKVNKLTKAGVTSGAAYEKALLDVKQAQEASTLAVTMHGEALEDQQRAYENFAMTLAPTILTAGSSITSMFKEMGGEKGLGGIASKLKGLSFGAGGLGGISGLTGLLGPLAIAAAAAGLAIAEYQNAMAKAAAGKKELDLAKNAKTLAEELEHIKKAGDEFKLQPGKNWLDALVTLSPTGGLINPMVDYFTKGKVAAAEAATETDNLTKARERLNKALADPAMTDWYSKEGNAARLEKQHAEEAVKLAEAKEKQIPPTEKLSSSQAAVNKEMGVTNTLLDTMTKPFTGKSVFYLQAESVDHLIGRLNALAAEADRNKFWQLMTGGNKTATTMKTPLPLFNQENLDFFVGAWEGGMDTLNTEWEGFSKASDDAAAKIVADQKAAALEYETAWNKAFGTQVSALDKIFAAYHKLHPGGEKDILDKKGKKIGTRTTAPGQLPVDIANKAFEAFEAGLAQKITSPASAKTYAKNWMTTASAHMSGIAGQLISPITTYIKEHGNDAPEAFLAGLKDTIANYDSTKTFQELLQPGVQVGGTVGTTAGNVMAKNVNTGLKDIKIPPSTISALDAQLAKVKADMAKKPATITVTAKTNEAIKLSQEARNIINKMTAKIKVGLSYASGSPSSTNAITKQLQSVWGGGKQAGYQGTVKRPTMFIAGEGGRPEDVTVRPRGSVQRGGSGGGGGGSTHITVSFEPQEFAQFIRYRINDNQGVVK